MSRPGKAFLLVALLLAAVPLAAIGLLAALTRALGDDFCSFYFADRFGLLRSIWYWRINWSGRYSAFAADWLADRLGGVHALPFLLPLLLGLWLLLNGAALVLLLRSSALPRPHLLTAFALASVSLILLLTLTPDLPQSFLWWNGMRSYSLPLIALALYALLYLGLVRRLDAPVKIALGCAVSFLLWFLSGGLSETFAVFQFALLIVLSLACLFPVRRPGPALPLILSGLAGAALSLWVTITAPGNALRQSQLPSSVALPDLWVISWRGFGHYLAGAVDSPLKIAMLAGALLFALWVGSFYPVQRGGWWIPELLAAGLLLSFVCIPPAVYGYGEIPPARTIIIPFFALTACLLAASFLAGGWLPAPARLAAILPALILLAYAAFGGTRLLLDQRADYQSFAREWDRAEESILQARRARAGSVTVPASQNWAGINVLNDNPKFWVNVCYSQYYAIPVFGRGPE